MGRSPRCTGRALASAAGAVQDGLDECRTEAPHLLLMGGTLTTLVLVLLIQ